MKQSWTDAELAVSWALLPQELLVVRAKSARWPPGFALQWKFFELEHRFLEERAELPDAVVLYVTAQLGAHRRHFDDYALDSRTSREHRSEIRALCGGWRAATVEDGEALIEWPLDEGLDKTAAADLESVALQWFRQRHIETPPPGRIDRLCRSAVGQHLHGAQALDGMSPPTGRRARCSPPETGMCIARFAAQICSTITSRHTVCKSLACSALP